MENEPDGAPGGPFPEAKDMKLRRETIVMAPAILVIVAAIPFAIIDTKSEIAGCPARIPRVVRSGVTRPNIAPEHGRRLFRR